MSEQEYRTLSNGEVIESGDEWKTDTSDWMPDLCERFVGKLVGDSSLQYRRKKNK